MFNMMGLGAVYRSDGREYNELVKLGLVLGLISGIIAAILSLIFGPAIFPNFIESIGNLIVVAIITFGATVVSVVLGLIIDALIYDFGNILMDN